MKRADLERAPLLSQTDRMDRLHTKVAGVEGAALVRRTRSREEERSTRTALERLQNWFFAQRDGDWEHGNGVRIEAPDNPGWIVRVDLRDTGWESVTLPRRIVERSPSDWIQTELTDGQFVGAGDP